MKSLQEKYAAALIKRGESEVKKLTGCRVFTRQEGCYFYLGNHGSLRFGATRGGSVPVSPKFKEVLLRSLEVACGYPHCKCFYANVDTLSNPVCPKGLYRERI